MTLIESNAEKSDMPRQNQWRALGWSAAAILLITPLVAMQFTDEVNWEIGDFAVFAAMLGVAGGLFELAMRSTGKLVYRVAIGITIAAAFLLVWVDGAVGIF